MTATAALRTEAILSAVMLEAYVVESVAQIRSFGVHDF